MHLYKIEILSPVESSCVLELDVLQNRNADRQSHQCMMLNDYFISKLQLPHILQSVNSMNYRYSFRKNVLLLHLNQWHKHHNALHFIYQTSTNALKIWTFVNTSVRIPTVRSAVHATVASIYLKMVNHALVSNGKPLSHYFNIQFQLILGHISRSVSDNL